MRTGATSGVWAGDCPATGADTARATRAATEARCSTVRRMLVLTRGSTSWSVRGGYRIAVSRVDAWAPRNRHTGAGRACGKGGALSMGKWTAIVILAAA